MTQYLCLPLKKNIKKGHDDWQLMKCPECGRECWSTQLARDYKKLVPEAVMLCTECSLRK